MKDNLCPVSLRNQYKINVKMALDWTKNTAQPEAFD